MRAIMGVVRSYRDSPCNLFAWTLAPGETPRNGPPVRPLPTPSKTRAG